MVTNSAIYQPDVIHVLVEYAIKIHKRDPYLTVNISGNKAGLIELANALMQANGDTYAILSGTPKALHPYTDYASGIRIIKRNSLLVMMLEGNILTFFGTEIVLKTLQDFVQNLVETTVNVIGQHIHVEYYDEHPYISPFCDVSLVIEII